MDSRIAKLILLVVLIPLSSCRIGTAVFQGGDVLSLSGSRDCLEGRTCEFEVTDAQFSETFTAVPKPGYAFVKWRAGDGHLCANSTNPVCNVTNVGSEGIPEIEAVIASDEMFYLVPEFECALESCPDILLDSVLLELVEQSELVEEYVAFHGSYPVINGLFGLNTSFRGPEGLLSHISIQPTFLTDGDPIYLVAIIFNGVWDGTGINDQNAVSAFSLSGSTNADNSMTWECIPFGGPLWEITTPPYEALPIECRGI